MNYQLPGLDETWVQYVGNKTILYRRFNGAPGLSLRFVKSSTTRKHTEGIQLVSVVSGVLEDSGESENIFLSAERSCSANSMPDDVLRVDFTPWRLTQSQFRYRGEPNVIDLGEL